MSFLSYLTCLAKTDCNGSKIIHEHLVVYYRIISSVNQDSLHVVLSCLGHHLFWRHIIWRNILITLFLHLGYLSCWQPACEVGDDSSKLQMEINLRSIKNRNCASIIFINMRIFCVMDWMMLLKDYLASNPEKTLLKQVPRYVLC